MDKSLILLAFLSLFIFSCKQDEDTPSNHLLITITGLSNPAPAENYIIVSNLDGQILNSVKVSGTDDIPIYSERSYSGNNINLITVSKRDGAVYADAYINLKKGGSFDVTYNMESKSYVQGLFHFKNYEDVDTFSVSTSNNYLQNITHVQFQAAMGYSYAKGSSLYVSATRETGKYFDFFSLEDKENITIDFATVNKPLLSKSLSVPLQYQHIYYDLAGRPELGNSNIEYIIDKLQFGKGKTMILKHPGVVFQEYVTFISATISDNEARQMTNIGAIPDTFQSLDAKPTVESSSLTNFSINSPGNFDSYVAHFINAPSSGVRVFFQSSVNGFRLPEFGKAIGKPEFKLGDLKLSSISLYEYDNYENDPTYNKLYNEGTSNLITEKSKQILTNRYLY